MWQKSFTNELDKIASKRKLLMSAFRVGEELQPAVKAVKETAKATKAAVGTAATEVVYAGGKAVERAAEVGPVTKAFIAGAKGKVKPEQYLSSKKVQKQLELAKDRVLSRQQRRTHRIKKYKNTFLGRLFG